jgi:tetratricopeptide (TPR) repeat protein
VSPRSALAHFAKGHMLLAQERYDEAILEYETVLVFNRNWLGAISHLGLCKFFTGSIEEAIPLLEQAIRVSPRDPSIGNWYFFIGTAHLVQSQVDDAITWAKKARSANPGHPRRYALLASAYALKGQTARAAAELAKARRLSGDNRYSSIASLKVGLQLGVPEVRALFETTLFRRSPQGRNARGMTTTRRLAAILAADVAGYSRLIGADEGGTLRQLKAIRDELIDPMLAAHHGRLVETTGDGLLVEFSSIVDAPI